MKNPKMKKFNVSQLLINASCLLLGLYIGYMRNNCDSVIQAYHQEKREAFTNKSTEPNTFNEPLHITTTEPTLLAVTTTDQTTKRIPTPNKKINLKNSTEPKNFNQSIQELYQDSIHERYTGVKLESKNVKERALLSSKITVLAFCRDNESCEGLKGLRGMYPGLNISVASAPEVTNMNYNYLKYNFLGESKSKGDALNKMIGDVKTEYFLHLDSYHNAGQ